jgi:tetratricopeptide (TPR) repeat protein
MISFVSMTMTAAFAETQDKATLLQNGRDALFKHKFEEALSYYDQVLKIDPNNKAALDNKGVALGNLQQFDKALAYFDQVLKIDPSNIDALNNKGAALIKLGKFDDAITYFDKVLKIDPTNLVALSNKNIVLNHGNVNQNSLGNRFSISCQIEVRNSAGQLVTYMEPRVIYVPENDFLDIVLDTTGVGTTSKENGDYTSIEKSIIKENGKNFEQIKIDRTFVYYYKGTVVSKTGFEQGGSWVIYAYHNGYQLEPGDKVLSSWKIIRPAR